MQFKIGEYSSLTFISVNVNHPGEPELTFDAGGYRTGRVSQRSSEYDEDIRDGLFTETNEVIARLTKEEQDQLFDLYARLESLYGDYDVSLADSTSVASRTLESELKQLIAKIYKIIRFDDLLNYVKGNLKLKIPPELSDDYTTDDKKTPKYIDRTYRLSEYIDLMALCLGLRFMIPIWGPYMKIAAATEGVNMKEYISFGLIRNTDLYQWPPFARMDTYIRANIDDKDKTMANLLHFLSNEEIPVYAIAMTVIRKMAVAPLSYENDKFHLMKIMYTFSTSKIKSLSKTLEPGLRDKNSAGIIEDDNSSVFCLFKMKQQVSTGELEFFKTYISRTVDMAKAIDPTVDEALVNQCVKHALNIKDWKTNDVQKGLVAWTISPVITGSTVPLYDRETLRMALGVSQALLWHWGLHELAILLTAKKRHKDNDITRPMMGKRKLSDETLDKLNEIYPYRLAVQTPNRKSAGAWSDNSGIRGLELFNSYLSEDEWSVNCPKALAKMCQDSHKTGIIDPSPDLRESLAKLLIIIHDIIR